MARSEYVYVLTQPDQPPLAWTVKHELRTWLRSLPVLPADWRLWRCRDGQPAAAMTTMDIAAVLDGR
jgi:hypothetical protein